jgi:hypothetical protein
VPPLWLPGNRWSASVVCTETGGEEVDESKINDRTYNIEVGTFACLLLLLLSPFKLLKKDNFVSRLADKSAINI